MRYNKMRERKQDKLLHTKLITTPYMINAAFTVHAPDVTKESAMIAKWAGFGEKSLQHFVDLLAETALETIDVETAHKRPQVWHDYLRDDYTRSISQKRDPWNPTDNLDRGPRKYVLKLGSDTERDRQTVVEKLQEVRAIPKPARRGCGQKQLDKEKAEDGEFASVAAARRRRNTKLMDRRVSVSVDRPTDRPTNQKTNQPTD